MRALAEDYVGNAAFMAVDPARLRATIDTGWRPDFIITVWVLQHSAALIEDIDLLRRCRAPLFVVNNHRRAVPVDGGMWADDGQDIRNELWKRFTEVDYGDIPSGLGAERLVGNAFWGLYA